MIGQIKEVEVGGKTYELKKKGNNISLTVQSIFTELALKANMGDGDLSWQVIGAALMTGMRGKILIEMQDIIKECVFSPKITDESYEDLDFNDIPMLFIDIYRFQVGEAEKKSDSQKNTETIPIKNLEQES